MSANLSKDIKLEADGCIFYFKYLDWDSNYFKIKSYVLDVDKSILKPSTEIMNLLNSEMQDSFITLKIDSKYNRELLNFLQTAGFRYIDTEVTLKYNKKNYKEIIKNSSIEIKKLCKNKGLPYKELGSVYSLTRFHWDKNISKQKADLLWINYIKNYKPSPLNHIFIARYNSEVAGSILVNESSDKKRANLFFVSVVKRFSGNKIGSQLIQYVVSYFNNPEIITETQVKNIKALNFYIKNGFSLIEETKTIMHRWS